MPSESSEKTLEMRVAELEDKLAKLQAASQAGAFQYVPPCVVHYLPPCAQPVAYIPPCTQQLPVHYGGIPPCAAIPPCVAIPPCCGYYPAQVPAQMAQGGTAAVPPCSGAGKKTAQSGAAKDPSCEDFGALGT
jgi:hypothetical protein